MSGAKGGKNAITLMPAPSNLFIKDVNFLINC